ncbi:MAG: PepSY domain-containing protein [Hyphomonadaceae bacterium]|nr:PepSY domain-containing protein [Hyphomonadaceae bacterium]
MSRTTLRLVATLGVLVALALSGPAAAQTAWFGNWFQDALPPANAKPLSEIIRALEESGYRQITEVEFEDGEWEIEARRAGGEEVGLRVDPVSGEVTED